MNKTSIKNIIKDPDKIQKRLVEITKEMAKLGAVLFGDLTPRKHKYVKADGSVSYQKSQSVFRYANMGGKIQQRIPKELETEVLRMIKNGKEYILLRNEYEALKSALSLLDSLKKRM